MSYNETAALLGSIFGVVWALAFQLIPGLTQKFESYDKERKSQIMLAVLAVSAALIALGSCTLKSINLGISCTQQGLEQIGIAFIVALTTGIMSNQPTHSIAKNALPTVGAINVDVPPYYNPPPGIP